MKWSIKDFSIAIAEGEKIASNQYNSGETTYFEKLFESKTVENRLYLGDNLKLLDAVSNELALVKPKLIYMDPPFYSKANYFNKVDISGKPVKFLSYEDGVGQDFGKYISYMYAVLKKSYECLDDNGVLALHLDWHSVHYMKIVLDEIFGYDNFINEIIWAYKSGGASKRTFSRKHDTILIYSKSKDYTFNPLKEKSYNRGLKKYSFKGVEEFEDEKGWYTLVNMKDVWYADMVGRSSRERLGYATQKPEVVLRNIIEAFTDEGDEVWDLFLGSGTTLRAARKLKRNFLGCDLSKFSLLTAMKSIGMEKTSLFVERKLLESQLEKESMEICLFEGKNHFRWRAQDSISEEAKEILSSINQNELFDVALVLEEGLVKEICYNLDELSFEKEYIIFDKFGNFIKR